ncbi:MAG: hypothetical protein JKX81_13225 [Arenicella sp.]|nr:hypothetical protein [Arenicella sp.]
MIWKLFGERLDGWTNEDHPTETIPGDASTLPNGSSANQADLDFVASTAHPAGGMTSLTMEQKMLFARWIDLGAPLDVSASYGRNLGWFTDDNRPTLTISQPRQGVNTSPVTEIVVGLADAYTGVDLSSLSIKADFSVNGHVANTELSQFFTHLGGGVYRMPINIPLVIDALDKKIMAEVRDMQGNVTRQGVRFYTAD